MKKTAIKTVITVVLAMAVLAGEAFAGPGGGGRAGGGPMWEGGRGRGGPGWGQWMANEPQTEANLESEQTDNSWVPGPYCPWNQGPNQNIQGRQGPGQGGLGRNFQGPRGPYCPYCRGFGRWNMIIQREPMTIRGGGGPAMRGRGDSTFQRRDIVPRGRGMNNWPGRPGAGGIGGQGPGMQPRWFAPADSDHTNQPIPPRGRGWAPGWGPGWTPNIEPNQQPEKAPDANAPAAPPVEDQPANPQGE